MTSGVTNIPPLYCEDILYASYVDRLLIKSLGVQAGVVEPEDYKVSAGTGLQVNVKKGKAFVEQTKAIEESSNEFYNGLYNVLNPIEQNPYNNVEVSAVNPQIAQIILRVYDVGELKIGGSSYARLEWINGTNNAGATEAKMKEGVYEGRAALPQSSLRIANVLVPKNATKSSEYYIEDVRTKSNKFLNFKARKANHLAEFWEFVLVETTGKLITLPEPTTENALIGIYNLSAETSIESTGLIYGDFITGASNIKLLQYQHVILEATGGKWLIIAGEPKREQTYSAQVERASSTPFEASASRMAFVMIEALVPASFSIELFVGGIKIGDFQGIQTNAARISFSFLVPPKVTWEVRAPESTLKSSYLLL